MVELLLGADGKRRRFLVMKRAQPLKVAPGFFKRDGLPDHIDDVDARKEFLDKGFRDAPSHALV